MATELGKIPLYAYLDEEGRAMGDLPAFARDRDDLAKLYRALVFTRTFDAKAIALQRTGRLGTYASSLGQEAVAVGIGSAMRPEDVLLPSFREQGAMFLRGVKPLELLLYWGGDERGSDFGHSREDFPICVPVATHVPHAAGVALAMKLRREDRAALCVLGDGGTSKGDFYEALNFAGVWALPLVIVINNNQWAISVPRARQTAAATLAQKGVAAGITGEQVDGNDIIAVRARIEMALKGARDGDGPTVIEALSYRLSDHTTADDASRYRSDAEVKEQWKRDPVARLRKYLVSQEWWGKKEEEELLRRIGAEVDEAVEAYLSSKVQAPTSMFDHLYARLPAALAAQRADLDAQAAKVEGKDE